MLYSLAVLVVGIFIGQEYQIPSIKLLVSNLINYLQEKTESSDWQFVKKRE